MKLEARIYDHTHVWEGGEDIMLSIGQLVTIFGFSNSNPLYQAVENSNIQLGTTIRRNQEREAIAVSDFPHLLNALSELKNNKGGPRYKWTKNIKRSDTTINVNIPDKKTVIVYQAD